LEGTRPTEDLPGARKWFDSKDVGEAEATAVAREYIELSNAAANAGSEDGVRGKRSEVATRTEELLEQLRRCVVTDYASCD
jgi:transcription elongation GreA/GreB family factor